MSDESLKEKLEILQQVLLQCGEEDLARDLDRAFSGSKQEFQSFLVSNELWGGSGSIADQAGIKQGRHIRRRIEQELINLGTEQIEHGIVNSRTEMWVSAFRKLRREGI